MQAYARKLKLETERGSMLVYDDDVMPAPHDWVINRDIVSFRTGRCRFVLFDRSEGDKPKAVEAELRTRIKVFSQVAIDV